MGQYYFPLALKDDKVEPLSWLLAHDYKQGKSFQGLKLMEHSYIGNSFVSTVESLLIPGGPWYMKRIVWAGDYADVEKTSRMKYPEADDVNLFAMCNDDNKINPPKRKMGRYNYIVNHDKKLFVSKRRVPTNNSGVWEGKAWSNQLHPLSILTCEGNNRGGGDLRMEHPLIGSWARNRISVELTRPEGYTELFFNITEERGAVNLQGKPLEPDTEAGNEIFYIKK